MEHNLCCSYTGVSGLWNSAKQCEETFSAPEGKKTPLDFCREEILVQFSFSFPYSCTLCRLHIMLAVIQSVQTQYRILSLDAGCLVLDRYVPDLGFVLCNKILWM